jgi:palmitoyl-protein thioesterase
MKERAIYKQDNFGLKTLDESGRILFITQPGIDHFNWHKNLSVIDNHIIPHLD